MQLTIPKYKHLKRRFIYDYSQIDDGQAFGDIIEIIYLWQKVAADADDAFLLLRRSSNQITLDETTKEVVVTITDQHYDNVNVGDVYNEIFAIKYSGDTQFRWMFLKDSDDETVNAKIKISQPWVEITS